MVVELRSPKRIKSKIDWFLDYEENFTSYVSRVVSQQQFDKQSEVRSVLVDVLWAYVLLMSLSWGYEGKTLYKSKESVWLSWKELCVITLKSSINIEFNKTQRSITVTTVYGSVESTFH